MRASLIFSSTSHSINVQKVLNSYAVNLIPANQLPDLQDSVVKSFRPQMHYSGD